MGQRALIKQAKLAPLKKRLNSSSKRRLWRQVQVQTLNLTQLRVTDPTSMAQAKGHC